MLAINANNPLSCRKKGSRGFGEFDFWGGGQCLLVLFVFFLLFLFKALTIVGTTHYLCEKSNLQYYQD